MSNQGVVMPTYLTFHPTPVQTPLLEQANTGVHFSLSPNPGYIQTRNTREARVFARKVHTATKTWSPHGREAYAFGPPPPSAINSKHHRRDYFYLVASGWPAGCSRPNLPTYISPPFRQPVDQSTHRLLLPCHTPYTEAGATN